MKRQILLPTDFSDNAWSAIAYAIKLFKNEECTFYILNSIALDASTMYASTTKVLRAMKDNANKELYELKNQIETSETNTGHDFITIISTLDLYDAIEVEMEKNHIDLVVMGTKGATGAKEFFFGSNTVKTIKRMNKGAILVVPNEYDYVTPRQIAFPTDFNRNFSEEELQPLKVMAALHNSKIRILHIHEEEKLSPKQEHHFDCLKNHFEGFEYSFHWMPDYSTKEREIKEFVEDLEIDMLCMVHTKHSCIARITHEPVINKIGFKPIVPFLVISV
jgi:nucleotide-binding universal stress UspA family protein